MTYLQLEIREYPLGERISEEALDDNGARMIAQQARELLERLEE